MSCSERGPATSSRDKPRRSKTFTGCFTCRSRKIRCDLKKHFCNNCIKAGLVCAGYDIKLRWSEPLTFSSKTGSIVSSSVNFKASGVNAGEEESPEFFQRRHVGFVKWDEKLNIRPYETYEEMDRDLNIIHNSGSDELVKTDGKTKLLGPFGVFIDRRVKKRTKGNTGLTKRQKKSIPEADSAQQAKTRKTKKFSPQVANDQEGSAQDHLWLSNELRDDALLTAAALNGDPHFLELMTGISRNGNNVYSPNSNNESGSPGFTRTDSQQEPPTHSNHNDILNLVFHRNQHPFMASNNGTNSNGGTLMGPSSQTDSSAMSNILNEQDSTSNIIIDPTNQHLYYSNYNNYYYNNPYQLNENLEIHLHAPKAPNSTEEESTDIVEGYHSSSTQMPDSIMRIVKSPLRHGLGFELAVPQSSISSSNIGIPTTALQVQPLTRYLLNYYVTQVADLMTVIPLTENPWKTIYFPRALMAIGELSALGQTSTAKNALLNALLAVAAFNLQSKFPKNSESMKFYLHLGIKLRNQASLFVRKLLNSGSDPQSGVEFCVSNEKYKDVLCAVMSMISVDLVWGTMQDTNLYIKWCEKVIRAKMVNKKKLSSKARILHRIFSSLRLIQDSTCLDPGNIKDAIHEDRKNEYDVNGDKYGVSGDPVAAKGKVEIDYIVNDIERKEDNGSSSKNTSPMFVNKKLINTKKNDENFATDALYGLPNHLIILFSETVYLLRLKIYHDNTKTALPGGFRARLDSLGDKLSTWRLDWKLYEGVASAAGEGVPDSFDTLAFFSPMHEATYHHIMSFYYALTIYFDRLLKNVSPEGLQAKVHKTLDHLNAIQKLIARDDAAIIPLFWQGFIAGCEAVDPDLQAGFKKWGADIAQYLGSYWGARQIMLEVWRRKRSREPRDDWVSVIQDWEMNLMLD